MPWMMFAFALLSFIVLCYAHSIALAAICIVLTIGLVVAGLLKIMAARVNDASRDGGHIITTEELRLYREQAQARKQMAAAPGPSATSGVIEGQRKEAPTIGSPADPAQPPPVAP